MQINPNAGTSLSHFRKCSIRPGSDQFLPHSPGVSLPQWESLQAQYWLSNNSSCSPCLWAKQLSSQLLNITHGMWLFQNQQLQEYQQMSLTQQPPWSTKSLHLGSTISSLRISFTFSPPPWLAVSPWTTYLTCRYLTSNSGWVQSGAPGPEAPNSLKLKSVQCNPISDTGSKSLPLVYLSLLTSTPVPMYVSSRVFIPHQIMIRDDSLLLCSVTKVCHKT